MKKYLIAALCVLTSSSFAQGQPNQKAMATTIAIKEGQTSFQIRLKSNRTTGYAWFLAKCSHGIKPVSASYIAPQTKLVGAPGSSVWTFDLDKKVFTVPRVLMVKMVYMRPWDASTKSPRTFYIVTGS